MTRLATLGLSAALALGAAGPASATPGGASPVHAARRSDAPAPATAEDVARYAQREQEDRPVADYEGGNVVVIGVSGSALVVVLLTLLLI